MALQELQDTNPYSRNLILVSMAIIIFILADGKIYTENPEEVYLKIHVLNIHFYNINVLEKFVLLVYIWVNYRFWQIKKVKVKDIIYNETYRYTNCFISKKFMQIKFKNKYMQHFQIGLSYQKDKWQIFANENGISRIPHTILTGLDGFLFVQYIKLKVLFYEGKILTYNVPYVLSFYALILYVTK